MSAPWALVETFLLREAPHRVLALTMPAQTLSSRRGLPCSLLDPAAIGRREGLHGPGLQTPGPS